MWRHVGDWLFFGSWWVGRRYPTQESPLMINVWGIDWSICCHWFSFPSLVVVWMYSTRCMQPVEYVASQDFRRMKCDVVYNGVFVLLAGNIIISIMPPISTDGMTVADLNDLMDRTHKLMDEEFSVISSAAQEGKNLNWIRFLFGLFCFPFHSEVVVV